MTTATTIRDCLRASACAALLMCAAAPARAETYRATVSSRTGLVIRSNEPESDALLRAKCASGGKVALRFGGDLQFGDGEGGAVEARLVSGRRTQTLRGVSRWSEDSEMTGGTELVATLAPSDAALGLLAAGGAIKVSGGRTRSAITLDAATAARLRNYLQSCSG